MKQRSTYIALQYMFYIVLTTIRQRGLTRDSGDYNTDTNGMVNIKWHAIA
jgi:hypothetical protein